MIELDEIKYRLTPYEKELDEIKDALDLQNKEERIIELERTMEAPGFWDDMDKAQKYMKELKNLKDSIETYNNLKSLYDDILVLIEMGEESEDAEIAEEAKSSMDEFASKVDEVKIKTLLSGEYDKYNAILKLNAGAGGTESCDWTSMLYRMYTRWAESKGFTTQVLDFLEGEEAGIKSITVQINGENAYGYLKSERGVHRLVRISPFNAAGKRQTSFASCDVMPDIEEDLDVEINDDDIRIDTYRSSGAGGQHINKTSSAIRITHLPTKIVVTCQNERSQIQNKEQAMKVLKARLYEMEVRRKEEESGAERKSKIGTGDRAEKIRTYNYPQNRVTDHRIGYTTKNLDRVMNGELDDIIEALITEDQKRKLAGEE